MSFELSEIRQESDFLELLQVLFVAYEDPFNPVRPLFYPILGHGPEARDTAIRESAERVFQRHKQNPSGRWVKVTDSSTGRFVGAALWMFFDKDPYTAQSLPECAWWPEGEGREFANLWSWGIRGPRVRYMSKPHACKCVSRRFGLILSCDGKLMAPKQISMSVLSTPISGVAGLAHCY